MRPPSAMLPMMPGRSESGEASASTLNNLEKQRPVTRCYKGRCQFVTHHPFFNRRREFKPNQLVWQLHDEVDTGLDQAQDGYLQAPNPCLLKNIDPR